MRNTHEGGRAYEHSLDHAVEFFSKAGSLFEKRGSFYSTAAEESALSLFQQTWIVDPIVSFRLMLWLRDCRGGAGNRSGARACYRWLANHEPEWIRLNLGWIPEVGRWDDLRVLFGTELESDAATTWVNSLSNVLAAKWADRKDKPLRVALGMTESEFRKHLAEIRKQHIVEYKMCGKQWQEIKYEAVPSVAMSRYTKAFGRNDGERFTLFKEDVKSGKREIKASVLFPHDCVRTAKSGERETAGLQFDALPNYMDTNERVIVIADTSASMNSTVSGSVRAVDVSQGMALYCSAKIPKDNPFYKKFIGFSSEGKFVDWSKLTFSQALTDRHVFDGAVGSTQIDKALDLILKTAKFFSLSDDHMPTALIIVSDMQFHPGGFNNGVAGDGSEVEFALSRWVKDGYKAPRIVYWNTAGYAGSPANVKSPNVGLVSGFSPAILKAVFSGEDFTPRAIMMRALEKYSDIIVPW